MVVLEELGQFMFKFFENQKNGLSKTKKKKKKIYKIYILLMITYICMYRKAGCKICLKYLLQFTTGLKILAESKHCLKSEKWFKSENKNK